MAKSIFLYGFSVLILAMRASKVAMASTPLSPCAINVAHATPRTPHFTAVTNAISSATLNTDENMRKYSGVLLSPKPVNMAVAALYKNKNGKPAM